LSFLLFPLLIVFLLPKGSYFKSYALENYSPRYVMKQIYGHFKVIKPNTEFEDYIASKTNKNSCILSVYGWSVGETYYYAQRRPCTRFFLTNMVVEGWQEEEYRKSILKNPPQAIVYTQSGANLEVARFEREVINLTQIIGQCYQPDSQHTGSSVMYPTLYFPRFSGDRLKVCLQQNVF